MKNFIISLVALFLAGCSAISGHGAAISKYNSDFLNPDCNETREHYLKKVEKNDDIILSANQAASLARKCGDYKGSNELFDLAESAYKDDVDNDGLINKTGQEIGSALLNENVLDYDGFYYERVMTNVYKALNFMSLGDFDNARVELNRALERQRRAKEMYDAELVKAKEELDGKFNNVGTHADEMAKYNEQSKNNLLSEYESSMGEFAVLPDFINPFVSYLGGVFFYMQKDYQKADELMSEVARMYPDNEQVLSDFELISKASEQTNADKISRVWLIYENGQTIARDEFKIDIPLFILSYRMPNVGIALTRLQESTPSFEYLSVNDKHTTTIADMDSVVKSEFKKQMPLRITRAVARAITKAAVQVGVVSAGKEAGGDTGAIIGGLIGGIYSVMTNRSDVRFWSSLPMKFEALRLDGMDERSVDILASNGEVLKSVYIPKGKSGIIYVKSLTPAQSVVHQMFN